MLETVGRLVACYEDQELPPAIAEVRGLVEARDHDALRGRLGTLWNQIVEHHRSRGVPFQPKASHAFRTLDTIVRNL